MDREQVHYNNRKRFSLTFLFIEIFVVIMYGLFVRVQPHTDATLNPTYYPMYQDVNVMMLIGFGFLMAFIKKYSWSALAYTFFINAIVVQLYLLLQPFWSKVFHGKWEETHIFILQKSFTSASYAVASMLIAFGALLGKVGPFELLLMGVLGSIGYTLNQAIVYEIIHMIDAGGSASIHTFGAYYGLTISFILSKKQKPTKSVQTTPTNTTFAMIGTLFLWMFWPSFNAGYFFDNPLHRSIITSNTIISLTGSCITAFILSGLLREKFSMEDILNASLAGGVAIGAPSGVTANAGISLVIGMFAGAISTLCFVKLSKILEKSCLQLYDTCGVNNLHGIPGLCGGFISAMVIASYQTPPGLDSNYENFMIVTHQNRNFSQQAGIQVAGTFISLGIGIVTGVIVGLIIYPFYNFGSHQFFNDAEYFQVPIDDDSSRLINPICNPTQIVLDTTN